MFLLVAGATASVLGSALALGDDRRPSGCGTSPLPSGTSAQTLEFGGRVREFSVHVPERYDPDELTPLVLSFHGWGGSGNVAWLRANADLNTYIALGVAIILTAASTRGTAEVRPPARGPRAPPVRPGRQRTATTAAPPAPRGAIHATGPPALMTLDSWMAFSTGCRRIFASTRHESSRPGTRTVASSRGHLPRVSPVVGSLPLRRALAHHIQGLARGRWRSLARSP